MMRRWIFVQIVALVPFIAAGEALIGRQPSDALPELEVAELWQEPVDLLQRDLYAGPGGLALAPSADAPFEFVAHKTSGTNPGYDVQDGSGRLWSVKLGVEAQSEVTSSRILWAMGFHQPAVYYLPQWTLTGEDAGIKVNARFRTDLDQWKAGEEWSWHENPFVDTQPFRGLIVTQMILNSWDLKTANNRVYDAVDPTARPRRLFMVRDLGSSLGTSKQSLFFSLLGTRGKQGSKNDLEGFEQQGFIRKVEGGRVYFDYRGPNNSLVELVTVTDVIWACELLGRVPDGHWDAAFRAGGYTPEEAERYVRKIKVKIADGLALRSSSSVVSGFSRTAVTR